MLYSVEGDDASCFQLVSESATSPSVQLICQPNYTVKDKYKFEVRTVFINVKRVEFAFKAGRN